MIPPVGFRSVMNQIKTEETDVQQPEEVEQVTFSTQESLALSPTNQFDEVKIFPSFAPVTGLFPSSKKASITTDELALFRADTFHGGNYLANQLFPSCSLLNINARLCVAYMYVLPDAFMIFLAATQGFPALEFTHTGDGSEVARFHCYPMTILNLSINTYEKLITFAKQVQVTDLNGISQEKEWDLAGVPPFICIEGRWNESPVASYGTVVDWEALISGKITQTHEAFELHLVNPTWSHIPQTPTLRGLSFNHSKSRFNIWIHEKNLNALVSKQNELKEEIDYLKSCIQFIEDFEKALLQFKVDLPPEVISENQQDYYRQLFDWAKLAKQIPFLYLKEYGSEVSDVFKKYSNTRSEEDFCKLIESLREFFDELPEEAHFPTDYTLSNLFNDCYKEFVSSGSDLVRDEKNFIDAEKLKDWIKLLAHTSLYFGNPELVDQLLKNSKEYLSINDTLRNQKQRKKLGEDECGRFNQRRQELAALLKKQYQSFFQEYCPKMANKGTFVKSMEHEILVRKREQGRLSLFTFCESPTGNISVEDLLTGSDGGSLDLYVLQALIKMLKFTHFGTNDRLSQLLASSEKYIRSYCKSTKIKEIPNISKLNKTMRKHAEEIEKKRGLST